MNACNGETPDCRLTAMGVDHERSDEWRAERDRLNREMGLPAGTVALTWCERHSCRIVGVRSIAHRLPDGSVVRR
jgi:hypothetical protein